MRCHPSCRLPHRRSRKRKLQQTRRHGRRGKQRGGQQQSPPILSVTYPPHLQVAGQQLTQQQTAATPTLTFSSLDPKLRYTLLMHDPDAVTPSYIHWLITDITAGNPKGTTVIPYQGPSPPPHSAPVHRYIFTLFVTPTVLQAPNNRAGFDAGAFLKSMQQIATQHITVESSPNII